MEDQPYQLFRLIGNWALIWMGLVGTASVIVHLRVVDYRSTISLHLLVYMSAIALVLDLGVVKLAVGDSWWFQMARLAAFLIVGAAMTQRLVLQVMAQRVARRAGRRPDPHAADA